LTPYFYDLKVFYMLTIHSTKNGYVNDTQLIN